MTNQTFSPTHPDDPAQNQADGPPPHEDFTIGEFLQTVHADSGAKHPGKSGYRRDKGKVEWIDQAASAQFIAKHGADHPSNYKEQYGHDWEDDFFQPSGTPRIRAVNTDFTSNAQPVKCRSKEACSDIGEEVNDLLASAHDTIQRNPFRGGRFRPRFGNWVPFLESSGA